MHELENSNCIIPQNVPSPLILCALDCTLYNSKLVRWAPLELYRVCPRQKLPKDTFSNTILIKILHKNTYMHTFAV